MNNQEEKSLEKIQPKVSLGTKIIKIIKNKWLLSSSMTIILVVVLILLFIFTAYGMQALNLTPIDLTAEKQYTLTDESKEKVADIDKDVNVYLIGYSEDSTTAVITKQYNKANEKINVEVVDLQKRTDLAQKYGIDSNETQEGFIIECGDRSRVLDSGDLITYDQNTYKTIDITEEKVTSSILAVTTERIPKVYMLTTYCNQAVTSALNYLQLYLENEILEVEEIDLLTKGSVPEDCDTLIIYTPDKDFEDIVSNEIIKYINKGGNIVWFNASYGTKKELPNVNKVLATYGVNPFELGYIIETDTEKMIAEAPYIIIPEIGYTEITKDLSAVLFVQATKINLVSDEKLEELNVESQDILTTSEKSFFRSNISINSMNKTNEDQDGSFVVGSKLTKTIKDDLKSTMIIFGENFFVTDNPLSQSSQTPLISYYNNVDLVINSVDYLTQKEEDISVRKATVDETEFTATEQEFRIVMIIIFAVPVIIIIVGIVVWQLRRRRK